MPNEHPINATFLSKDKNHIESFESFQYKKLANTHTEKIRNTTRGSRLWEVKNSGCKNSSPTEVKRTFIHQNLSIFIAKSMRNFC
jgi:hypothetical protein